MNNAWIKLANSMEMIAKVVQNLAIQMIMEVAKVNA